MLSAASHDDIRGLDVAALVREAQSNGCECDVCEGLRAIAEYRRRLGSTWTGLRWAIIVGATCAVLVTVLMVLDIFFDIT